MVSSTYLQTILTTVSSMQLLTGACLVITAANTNASTLVPMEIIGVSVIMDTLLLLIERHAKVRVEVLGCLIISIVCQLLL